MRQLKERQVDTRTNSKLYICRVVFLATSTLWVNTWSYTYQLVQFSTKSNGSELFLTCATPHKLAESDDLSDLTFSFSLFDLFLLLSLGGVLGCLERHPYLYKMHTYHHHNPAHRHANKPTIRYKRLGSCARVFDGFVQKQQQKPCLCVLADKAKSFQDAIIKQKLDAAAWWF